MEASEELSKQAKKNKVVVTLTAICCSYWMINSFIGIYTLYSYPLLQTSHPNLYRYLQVFSLKWVIAFMVSLALLIVSCMILKLCCKAQEVFANSLGAFPLIYVFVIFMSYMFSLYYGIVIILEIYSQNDLEQPNEYDFQDLKELILIKLFVINEIVVGALVLCQCIYTIFGGRLSKSPHLEDIEPGWGVTNEEVEKAILELQQSRMKTVHIGTHQSKLKQETTLQQMKEDLLKGLEEDS